MPIPGSRLDLLFDSDVASELMADVLPSRGTYLACTKSAATTGQELHTFAAIADPEYTDIPCRKAPLILVRPQDQEWGARDMPNMTDARWQVTMMGSFPLIDREGQFQVDGVTYQIKAVETDGNGYTTRLLLGDEVPFNA